MCRKVMFLFIWVNYLNVNLMDFVFLEPSVFLYIAYFVELCFLAIFFAFRGNFACTWNRYCLVKSSFQNLGSYGVTFFVAKENFGFFAITLCPLE